jgi:hypothetical protein
LFYRKKNTNETNEKYHQKEGIFEHTILAYSVWGRASSRSDRSDRSDKSEGIKLDLRFTNYDLRFRI